jgi:mRNA interferase RelE/StbE
MASYEIEISRSAEKQLRKLPREDQQRIVRAILPLAQEPLPKGSRKLSGYEDVFRIRVGRYRILYSVSSRKLVIIILKIGHRRDVYR